MIRTDKIEKFAVLVLSSSFPRRMTTARLSLELSHHYDEAGAKQRHRSWLRNVHGFHVQCEEFVVSRSVRLKVSKVVDEVVVAQQHGGQRRREVRGSVRYGAQINLNFG
jgi:hypothetical protein